MEIGGYGYDKPEYVRLAEQIYQCKNDKEALELELNNMRFHYDYIKKRKGLVFYFCDTFCALWRMEADYKRM